MREKTSVTSEACSRAAAEWRGSDGDDELPAAGRPTGAARDVGLVDGPGDRAPRARVPEGQHRSARSASGRRRSAGASVRSGSSGDRPAVCAAWSRSSRPRPSSPGRSPSSPRTSAAGPSGRPRIASARELAAASVANLDDDPELGVLLAIEAVQATRSVGRDGPPGSGGSAPPGRRGVPARPGGSRAWEGCSPGAPRGVFVTEGPENSGVIDIRDSETGERVRSWQGHDGDVTDVAFSPDGSRLATTGEGRNAEGVGLRRPGGSSRAWRGTARHGVRRSAPTGHSWPPPGTATTGTGWSGSWTCPRTGWSRRFHVSEPIDTALSPDGRHVAVAKL